MLVIIKIRFSGSGKVNMQSKSLKVYNHPILPSINAGNIIQGEAMKSKCTNNMCANANLD